jgi:hypothetical protein
MSWLARLDAALAQRARERSEESERSLAARGLGPLRDGEDAKKALQRGTAPDEASPFFASPQAEDRAQTLGQPVSSPSSLLSQRADAARLARAAEDVAAALAAPDPGLAHERQVIAEALVTQGQPVPEPEHRAAVDGLLDASMQRPPARANVSLTPPRGAWCSCCRGRRWWTEAGPVRRGWRCVVCRPPLHLRPEDVMERQT